MKWKYRYYTALISENDNQLLSTCSWSKGITNTRIIICFSVGVNYVFTRVGTNWYIIMWSSLSNIIPANSIFHWKKYYIWQISRIVCTENKARPILLNTEYSKPWLVLGAVKLYFDQNASKHERALSRRIEEMMVYYYHHYFTI